MLERKRIGVLMGGIGPEREISLATGEAVFASLADHGLDVYRIFVDRDLDLVLRQLRIDVAFLALRGRYGEDGCVQGLLEMMGIPYTGSSVLASALAMDKIKAKEIFRLQNLPTPSYYVYRPAEDSASPHARHGEFGYPCIVKPADSGSSIGVSLVRDPVELEPALEAAGRFADRVLCERWIEGRQVSVAVLAGSALGAIEIATPRRQDVFDYRRKSAALTTDFHFPARLSPERYRGVLALAERAHEVLGCDGLTLVDLIVSDRGNEALLELNTLPGLSPVSLVPKIAHGCGLSFASLCERLLEEARLHTHARAERRRSILPRKGPERRAVPSVETH
jgi:D-alanine-D-alanine ligase